MAKNDLAALVVKLEAQTAQYMAGMQKAQAETERFRSKTTSTLNKLTSSFRSFGKAVVGYYSITHIASFIKRTADAADALGETAEQAGIGAEAMQRLQFAFSQLSQATAEQTTRGLSTFNKNLGDARTSSLTLQKAFNALGVDLHKNTEGALRQTLELLAQIEDPAERSAKAAIFFGDRFGPKLAGALGQGIDVIDAYAKAATGIVTDETIAKGSQLTDAMAAFGKTVDAAATEAVIANADSIIGLGKAMAGAIGWASRLATGMRNVGKDIGEAVERWTRPDDPSDPALPGATGEYGGASGEWEDVSTAVAAVVDDMDALVVVDLAAVAAQEKLRKASEAMTKSVNDQITALQLQADTMGMTEAQAALYGLQMQATQKGLNGLTLEQLASATAAIDSIERQKKALDEFDEALERDAEQQKDLTERTRDFSDALARDSEAALGSMTVFVDQAARNMQDSLADFLFDPFRDGLDGMLQGLIDVLRRMVAEMAAAELFGALSGIGAGGGGVLGAIGNFFKPRADGGPVTAGAPYMVGERGPELFIPNHSGSIMPNGAGGVAINQQIVVHPGSNAADMYAAAMAGKNAAIAAIDERTRRTRGRR